MAKLYISEFANIVAQQGTTKAESLAAQPAITDQTVSIGAGSLQSNPFNAKTNMILVTSDSVCSIVIGAASLNSGAGPTATASNLRIPANVAPIAFAVVPGQILAVITNS